MKTEQEIRERIKGIENQQKNGTQGGYIPVQDVRKILINNFNGYWREKMYNETFIEFIAGVILLFVLGLIVVGIDKTTCYKTAKKLNYQCEYSVWTGCVVIKSNDEKALLNQLRDFN